MDKCERIGSAPLGKGSFGYVVKVRRKKDGKLLAMKVQVCAEAEQLVECMEEANQMLEHKRIVKCIEHFYTRNTDGCYEHRIVMPLYAGSLKGYVEQERSENGRLGSEIIAKLLRDTGEALHFLHDNDRIHKDVRPENIFVEVIEGRTASGEMGFVLSDVGSHNSTAKTFVGTVPYLSPEQLRPQTYTYNEKIDIWGLGMTACWAVLAQTESEGQLRHDSGATDAELRELLNKHSGPPLGIGDIILQLLCKDPISRPTASQVVQLVENACGTSLQLDCQITQLPDKDETRLSLDVWTRVMGEVRERQILVDEGAALVDVERCVKRAFVVDQLGDFRRMEIFDHTFDVYVDFDRATEWTGGAKIKAFFTLSDRGF
eukprot:TRINITY_DN23243_c0_g1_i1.p1 TRINITY_DN23243_c0_g1~~TRINITY_DN23243_c0_g1_i1.p1  ORF type:complete len:381 (+),score=74.25 TRINITY_DN23243_c0_g1_i1:23-1144(+)